MPPGLTLAIAEDGAYWVEPPFYDTIEVARDAWGDLFESEYVLELEAENGEPIVYECISEDMDSLTFRRAVLM